MDISLINPYVIKVLKDNGWYENRKVDISSWIKQLTSEGYVCFDYAKHILTTLGGISVNVNNNGAHKGAQFNFDALDAGSGEYDRLEALEAITKEKLFPIGNMVQTFVYAGESKRIYWGYPPKIYLAGNSIEDYLNNLFDINCRPERLD